MRRITVARPDYLARAGRPQHPADLMANSCIVYTGLSTVEEWHFTGADSGPIEVKVSGRVRVIASEGMRAALLEGLGIAVCSTWLFENEIEAGVFEEMLQAFVPVAMRI